MYVEVARVHLCANHFQHIKSLSRATYHATCQVVRRDNQLLSLTELKSHLFELYSIRWTIKLMKDDMSSFNLFSLFIEMMFGSVHVQC